MFIRKSALFIVPVLLIFFLASCHGPEARNRYLLPHVGTWVGVDSTGNKGVVSFRENGTGTMELQNDAYEFTYVFDYSRQPMWLDLIYAREGKPFRAKLVVKFMDENRFQWFTFFSDKRPAAFPEKNSGNVMVLTRLSPVTRL